MKKILHWLMFAHIVLFLGLIIVIGCIGFVPIYFLDKLFKVNFFGD